MIVECIVEKIIVYKFCDNNLETQKFEVHDVVNFRFLRDIKITAEKYYLLPTSKRSLQI